MYFFSVNSLKFYRFNDFTIIFNTLWIFFFLKTLLNLSINHIKNWKNCPSIHCNHIFILTQSISLFIKLFMKNREFQKGMPKFILSKQNSPLFTTLFFSKFKNFFSSRLFIFLPFYRARILIWGLHMVSRYAKAPTGAQKKRKGEIHEIRRQ